MNLPIRLDADGAALPGAGLTVAFCDMPDFRAAFLVRAIGFESTPGMWLKDLCARTTPLQAGERQLCRIGHVTFPFPSLVVPVTSGAPSKHRH